MPDDHFNNQTLFSDYYLASVVPNRPEWAAARVAAAEAQVELRALWEASAGLVTAHEGQTEEHWVRPVLRRLGFFLQVQTAVPDATGAIRWPDYALFGDEVARAQAEGYAGTRAYFDAALAIADAKVWDAPLDRASTAAAQYDRRNPNYQIDAYLRETDRRWGILTNGRKWRLYCRDTSYRLDSFYEVDLIELLSGSADDFTFFWLFFRRESLEGQPNCLLDRVRAESQDFAESLSARVKGRVYAALQEFINGFFAYPGNGLDPETDLEDAYAGSLILLYRILFALYGEAHDLLPTRNAAYRDTYSVARIKQELATRLDQNVSLLEDADNYYSDLSNLFAIVDRGSVPLGVPPYNGGLFSPTRHPFLASNRMGDAYLARGLDLLARVPSAEGLVFVDYNTLQIRHLGDIYEGLLEYHPRHAHVDMVAVSHRAGRSELWKPAMDRQPTETVLARAPEGTCYLATGRGERRATGSYYTPQDIVARMVGDSVGTLIADLEAQHEGDGLVAALLNLRVCDPAMGSGHFLVETVDQIARAIIRAGGDIGAAAPGDNELQAAKRRVVERCVYGVDPNPLAVELAKLSLWLATVAKDRPLSFVDAHLVKGNSLIGARVADMASLAGGEGVAQMNLVEDRLNQVLPLLLQKITEIGDRDSDSLADVQDKERLFEELNELRGSFIRAANLWTARHFGVPVDEDTYLNVVTTLADAEAAAEVAQQPLLGQAQDAAKRYGFHHWELAFPEVFLSDARPRGFDAVVTNPPYVNATERRAAYGVEEDRYWRRRFAAAAGAFDLYVVFIEICLELTRQGGLTSLITPNKWLAAPYAKGLRESVVGRHSWLHLVDASRVPVFEDPSVYPIITLFRAHEVVEHEIEVLRLDADGQFNDFASHASDTLTRLPDLIWAFLLLEDAELLLSIGDQHPQLEGHLGLSAVASTSAAEADRFGPVLQEDHLAPAPGWKIVITGTISPYSGEWGVSRLQHQGRQFLRPTLPFRAQVVTENRRQQYWGSKLIFKKLCLRLQALLDVDGSYASMNTNFVLPGRVDPFALGALVHSTLMTWIYEGYFGALRMGGGYMQVQAPQLRVLPIPALPVQEDAATLDALLGDVEFAQLDLSAGPNDVRTASPERLYALLRFCGREAARLAGDRLNLRRTTVDELMTAMGVVDRRQQEPAFVLPRQDAILSAIEDPSATDLSAYWTPLRATARALRVDVGPARQQALLHLAQSARADLVRAVEQLEAVHSAIDEITYALYGLTPDQVAKVRSGHNAPPGLAVEADD